ncbi:hypothetical protein GCM10007061_10910 [Kocuria marina]|nr:hypothetical protein GCM10007061_10910 [Kocuria marina]
MIPAVPESHTWYHELSPFGAVKSTKVSGATVPPEMIRPDSPGTARTRPVCRARTPDDDAAPLRLY